MFLSRRTKEAIKTALAMTIAYGIALQMGWDEPMWAGFAVTFISLATIGQSFNKAVLRMLGTLVAAVVALIIIAFYAQDRWLLMLILSAWVGLCTYMMGGAKNQYFWNVSALACVIIVMDAGVDPINAFNTAILRTQETGLGILVYSVVAIFLWPSSSRIDFDEATGQLASTQHQLFRAYMSLLLNINNKDYVEKTQQLRQKEVRQQNRFVQLLAAAETDSYEVSEFHYQWDSYSGQAIEFSEMMERWRESFTEVQGFDLQDLLPNLTAFSDEIERRMSQVRHMLEGDAPTQSPQVIELLSDSDELNKLSFFQKAAFTVFMERLQSLDAPTRILFARISDIKNFVIEEADAPDVMNRKPINILLPDLDRLLAVVRIIVTIWLVYFTVIYVNDIPGGTGLLIMVASIGMALVTSPQIPISKLFLPAFSSVIFVGLLYIFVMPQLTSFWGLGLLIFSVTFTICYLFFAPQQMLGRAFGLSLFLAITSISNEQSYSFLAVTSTGLMFSLVFIFLLFTSYIPFSPHPERVFLRLLGRFFRCSEYLILTMNTDSKQRKTRLEFLKKAFYSREMVSIPNKLVVWGRLIDAGVLSGTSPEQIQVITTNLQALTYRIQELVEAGGCSQAPHLVQELLFDMRSWRVEIQESFQQLSQKPTIGNSEVFHSELTKIMDCLEDRVKETLSKTTEGQFSAQEGKNFYRLLGAFRGLSVALTDYVESTDNIDWTRWREERF